MPEQPSNRAAIYRWIIEETPERGRVLDIGCSSGDLLARLVDERRVHGVGIEISEELASKAVQRGLSVHHGNAEEGLDHYGDSTFDLVIISETIQETDHPRRLMEEVFRVGKRVVVVFPNFGHWRARAQLLNGHAPRTSSFPFTWYDSPNRHFFTIADWEDFCKEERWRIVRKEFSRAGHKIWCLANLRAEVAMYVLEKTNDK